MDTFSLAIIDSVRRSTIVAPHALISDVFFRDAIFLARHLRDRLPSANSAPSFLAPHSTLHHPFSFANPSFNWLVIHSLNRFRVDWIDFALIIHIILLHYYFQFQFWFSCSNRARLCTPIIYVLFLFLFRNAINRQASLVLLQFWSFLSLWTWLEFSSNFSASLRIWFSLVRAVSTGFIQVFPRRYDSSSRVNVRASPYSIASHDINY